MVSMRCTCVQKVFQEDMDLSEPKLIRPRDQITFDILVFPELHAKHQGVTKYRVFIRQVLLDKSDACIIELKNESLSIDSSTLRHLKQSIAVLVWRELGSMYKELDVRVLPLLESFSMQRSMFGNGVRPHRLVFETFQCSAIDYLEEYNVRQVYQTTKKPDEKADSFCHYNQVMALPRTQFQSLPPQPQFQLVFPSVQNLQMGAMGAMGTVGAMGSMGMVAGQMGANAVREAKPVNEGKAKNAAVRGTQKKLKTRVQNMQHTLSTKLQEQATHELPDLPMFTADLGDMLASQPFGIQITSAIADCQYESHAYYPASVGMNSSADVDSSADANGSVGLDSSAEVQNAVENSMHNTTMDRSASPVPSFTLQSNFNTPQRMTNSSVSTPGSKRVRQLSMWDDDAWESEDGIMHLLQDDDPFMEGMQPL